MDTYRVADGVPFALGSVDPREKSAYSELTKKTSIKALAGQRRQLAELQRLLWADGGRSLLLVLQAMDTGGKDGTIRKVFTGVNPQGVDVRGFGVPSDIELDHDYLWRVHLQAPRRGRIGIFNRSHYEDVLVVRVNGLVPEDRWRPRYEHIRNFERMLTDEGTVIVKVMLHISKEEQAERLQARLDDPSKNYKFNPSDLESRRRWEEYMAAYEEAINETSTRNAPWFVVPSDRKWYRNLVVSQILIDTLKSLDLAYPEQEHDLSNITIN
ncbi:MAG: polyphosphate kinase 2 family protein [Acidimicrobiia bacterium]|nr:MAG: polyphosphate kinase 2 family protein [Acidimicrobiia bacterium]